MRLAAAACLCRLLGGVQADHGIANFSRHLRFKLRKTQVLLA
jgi:hypothetical protein